MNTALPTSIPAYLEHLRRSLAGADPALVHDALYDAEEYLRSELAENPGRSEAEVIAAVASSYGDPDEVADIYRDTEATVQTALRAPPPPQRKSLAGRFFGVAADPRAYASLFYMVLALATGIFYFTWVVAGLSMSAGLAVLIIGIPFVILFFGSVRVLSLVEGRMVEVMLGERMPRRPLYSARGRSIWRRIGDMFSDPRTWSTMLYMLLMLPLGILYFTVAATFGGVALGFIAAPLALLPGVELNVWMFGIDLPAEAPWLLPVVSLVGVLLLFATLHMARGIGRLHGRFAKHLLVKSAQYS
ncbi:sensor domain-containing protein [Luteimonas sp. MC1825]|uniref:sensor domain-containing protein n=1 Tax=Luteimonas sp. MC1825 TaxID=2761107 RepID=UPI001620F4FA|nr:sensor domain-containing protein [Luteimonas sp. MC1825]MBB6598740.1 sensor domain-containing protein [Luteimonas sp. MC1825]QOC88904.1 sensor domain-containing protein [Luteimonas sp. MC1825]